MKDFSRLNRVTLNVERLDARELPSSLGGIGASLFSGHSVHAQRAQGGVVTPQAHRPVHIAAREAARRTQCSNNLRQLGLGLQSSTNAMLTMSLNVRTIFSR